MSILSLLFLFSNLFILINSEGNSKDCSTTTTTTTTNTDRNPKILYSNLNSLTCLRLFNRRFYQGDWIDICDSNELITRCFIWSTNSVCAPQDNSYDIQRYWLLYEQPDFQGPYVLLGEGQCIENLKLYRLNSVGSILTCTQEGGQSGYYVRCHYPSRPWRKFQALTQTELNNLQQKEANYPSRSPQFSAAFGQNAKSGQLPTTISLQSLKANSQNAKTWN